MHIVNGLFEAEWRWRNEQIADKPYGINSNLSVLRKKLRRIDKK